MDTPCKKAVLPCKIILHLFSLPERYFTRKIFGKDKWIRALFLKRKRERDFSLKNSVSGVNLTWAKFELPWRKQKTVSHYGTSKLSNPQLKELAQKVSFKLKKTCTLIFLLDFPFKQSHPFSSLLSSWRISLLWNQGSEIYYATNRAGSSW